MQPYFDTKRRNGSVLNWAAVGGALIFVFITLAALFATLHRLQTLPGSGSVNVDLGPLRLMRLSKDAASTGSYTVTFSLKSGIFLLLAVSIGIAATIGWWRLRNENKKVASAKIT